MNTQNATNHTAPRHARHKDRHARLEACRRHLRDLGLLAIETPSGDLRFWLGPREYYLVIPPDQDGHLAIARDIWQAQTPEEEQCAAQAASVAQQIVEGARIRVENGTVTALVEATHASHEAFFDRFRDYFKTLQDAITEFVRVMRTSLPRPPSNPLPVTKRLRAKAYRDHLAVYDVHVDEDENIILFADGWEYCIIPDYLWEHELCITVNGGIMTVTDPAERARVKAIIRHITDGLRTVRVWMAEDGTVHAVAKLYLADPLDIGVYFELGRSQLLEASIRLHAEIATRKQEKK